MMSVKTIYTCDKCGNEQFTKDQFWVVGVSAATLGERVGIGYVKDKLIHVCRPCLDSFGIYEQTKPSDPPNPELPTVEELIREIISLVQEGE